MIYLDDDIYEFSKKHGFKTGKAKCLGCGKEYPYTTPVAIKGYRGVLAEDHGCPDRFRRSIWKPVSKEELDFWNTVI